MLTTPVGIAPEALRGVTGAYCGPFDPAVWAEALVALLEKPDARVAGRAARTVLVHINNSNPILREGSPERAAVERSGVEIGTDDLEVFA